MKVRILFLCLVLNLCAAAAQSQDAPPGSSDSTSPQNRPARKQQTAEQRFDSLKSVGEYNYGIGAWTRATAMQSISRIYRKPTDKEAKLLAAGKDERKKFAAFLQQSNTGLTKLIVDRGCAESPSIFNISEDCLKYQMPGAGSSFSFREKNYRIDRLSDLTYDGEGFYSNGILSHALITNVGDVALENISEQTKVFKFLNDFQISADFEQARKTDKKVIDGMESDGLVYSRSAEAKENATYILRVIAYRGNVYRAFDGLVYDELDFDERRDVTVAFRIINRNPESVTILWKILSDQKSPALKKPSREELTAQKK